MFKLNLDEFKKGFFSNVMTPVERMQKRNTEILAGQTRRASQNSMKKAAKLSKKKRAALKQGKNGNVSSRPGEPPLEKVGLIKKLMYYAYDRSSQGTIVGPAKLSIRGSVSESLEKGLPTLIMSRGKIIEVPMPARPFMVPAMKKVMTEENIKKIYEKSLKPRKSI